MGDIETSLENMIYNMNHIKEFGGLSPKAMKNLMRLLKQESHIYDLDFKICDFRLLQLQFTGLKAGRSLRSCCHDLGERMMARTAVIFWG